MPDNRQQSPSDDLQVEANAFANRLRRRTLLFTMLPVIAGILLTAYASRTIASLSEREARALAEQRTLQRKADSVTALMGTVGSQFLAVTQALAGLQSFIESKASYLRTVDEARFLVGVRMRFDSLHTALGEVATIAPGLSAAWPQRYWAVVVASAPDSASLLARIPQWRQTAGTDSIGVYRTPNGQYALALLSDGSFTTAYRLTVTLQRSGRAPGAYFEQMQGWGPNLLP